MTTTSSSNMRILAVPADQFHQFPRLTQLAAVAQLILQRYGNGPELQAWEDEMEGEYDYIAHRWDESLARDMIREGHWLVSHRKAVAWVEVPK